MRPRPGRIDDYNLPRLPSYYQPRDSDLAELRARLGTAQATGIVGLRGMGGIGKTVLATALARDPSIHADFPYGVAWISFGRDALGRTRAAELAAAITGQSVHFESVSAARGQLGQLTQDLALLVVLDDIWEPEAADAFTGLGPKCRVLITTRDARVLTRANAARHDVGLLTPPAARAFLAAATALPYAAALPPEADAIICHCGHLPLALAAESAVQSPRQGVRSSISTRHYASGFNRAPRWVLVRRKDGAGDRSHCSLAPWDAPRPAALVAQRRVSRSAVRSCIVWPLSAPDSYK